ncbi:hypothetical protein C1H46_012043 [Malus baccata]|uniref:GPI inositol-deacylase n=1 Tax=Malus baccata TaxID=106549 RepID=A0A540MUD3_MALBA|nr:hypothetical protein C1H46_012043 [Malus baccata]
MPVTAAMESLIMEREARLEIEQRQNSLSYEHKRVQRELLSATQKVSTAITWFTICLEVGNVLLQKFPWHTLDVLIFDFVGSRRLTFIFAFVSIASRVQKSLQGSSDDIGWLQRTHGMPGMEDGTARILELLAGIRYQTNIISSAALDGLIHPWPFILCWNEEILFKDGFSVPYCKNYSKASVAHNAWELKQYIEELYWGSDKRVMLLGHSKGGVDATAALSIYWCDLKDKVAALALVQSPYGGTPLASGSLREGQVADKETRQIMKLLICKLIKGDIRALEDLTYEKRKEFHPDAQTPAEPIPLISFHSVASIAPGVLATMTHIAHAELPWLPLPNFGNKESDGIVIPLSAAMAVTALHLQHRYGEKSDGLVTCLDAEVPGSVVVRPERKLDHVWMVYSTKKKNPGEADASEM